MSDKEEEYEVESIREARVESVSRSKKAKLVWKFLVRWKGYSPDDDTWEPVDSFIGSEHIVEAFWERAKTDGRDTNDLSLFKAGETFRPIGPPKRPKRKSTNDALESGSHKATSQAEQVELSKQSTSMASGKRRHSSPKSPESPRKSQRITRNDSVHHIQRPPASEEKRSRRLSQGTKTRGGKDKVSPSRKQRKPPRVSSPEVIPDSDEEMNHSTSGNLGQGSDQQSFGDGLHRGHQVEGRETNLPLHRARVENPLVKVVDYPETMSIPNAIPTKAHAIERLNTIPSPSESADQARRAKPGPGRSSAGLRKPIKNTSSLLTFEKGSLKTVKGTYSQEKTGGSTKEIDIVDLTDDVLTQELESPTPEVAPSGQELLQLAGLDAETTENLPDFDEDDDNEKLDSQLNPDGDSSLSLKKLEKAEEIPAPETTRRVPDFTETRNGSTIFSRFNLGSDPTKIPEQTKPSRLVVNLDASVSIPILLEETIHLPNPMSLRVGGTGIPGKFYNAEAALALLGTVRAGGASALADVDQDASDEEQTHFAHFSSRLGAGDIFVAVAGAHILVFCSTGNTLLSHRLNAPSALLNDPSKILIAQVEIENYTGYADATANADQRRWSQFIAAN